jgi:hypothetical protein
MFNETYEDLLKRAINSDFENKVGRFWDIFYNQPFYALNISEECMAANDRWRW